MGSWGSSEQQGENHVSAVAYHHEDEAGEEEEGCDGIFGGEEEEFEFGEEVFEFVYFFVEGFYVLFSFGSELFCESGYALSKAFEFSIHFFKKLFVVFDFYLYAGDPFFYFLGHGRVVLIW